MHPLPTEGCCAGRDAVQGPGVLATRELKGGAVVCACDLPVAQAVLALGIRQMVRDLNQVETAVTEGRVAFITCLLVETVQMHGAGCAGRSNPAQPGHALCADTLQPSNFRNVRSLC